MEETLALQIGMNAGIAEEESSLYDRLMPANGLLSQLSETLAKDGNIEVAEQGVSLDLVGCVEETLATQDVRL